MLYSRSSSRTSGWILGVCAAEDYRGRLVGVTRTDGIGGQNQAVIVVFVGIEDAVDVDLRHVEVGVFRRIRGIYGRQDDGNVMPLEVVELAVADEVAVVDAEIDAAVGVVDSEDPGFGLGSGRPADDVALVRPASMLRFRTQAEIVRAAVLAGQGRCWIQHMKD